MQGDPRRGLNPFEKAQHKLLRLVGRHHKYAYQMIEQISNMNQGIYLERKGVSQEELQKKQPSNFCIGVVGDPNYNTIIDPKKLENEASFLKAKQDAGAEFVICQMVFSPEDQLKYIGAAKAQGVTIPFLTGIYVPFSYKNALRIRGDIDSIRIPFLEEIETLSSEDQKKAIYDNILKTCIELKQSENVAGIHLFTMNKKKRANQIIELIKAIQKA